MWIYKHNVVEDLTDLPRETFGFVYLITCLKTNKYYVGKKQVISRIKKKLTKKEKLELKTRKTFKYIIKESDWLNYNSSCRELQEDIKKLGEDKFKKEIIEICFNKKDLTYKEVYHQFRLQVLEKDTYNGNILNRFYHSK